MISLEEILNHKNVIDLSFFNFQNASTGCYFADRDLRILKVNESFRSFFPILGDIQNASVLRVLEQLGVAATQIDRFVSDLKNNNRVDIPEILLKINGEDKAFSLLTVPTKDPTFSYLNGFQGQFIDRTEEWTLRRARDRLMEERLRDRELIENKTRELERVANRLAKYLAPQVYDSIFSGRARDGAALARKNLTIFFSDIEGFTDITDGMEPERLAFFINTYLSEMANIAIEYGGTIDKFIGDAILVFFGDPETDGDRNDALKCAQMALRMCERMGELVEVWQKHGIAKPLHVRMGITTGYCTVGNFGSEQRLDYTVLGGPVNLASRLQTSAEPDTILMADSTYLLIRDLVDTTPMGEITPKGFVRPVGYYKLNGLRAGSDVQEALTRVGRHVAINIADRRHIREALEELHRIELELAQYIGPE